MGPVEAGESGNAVGLPADLQRGKALATLYPCSLFTSVELWTFTIEMKESFSHNACKETGVQTGLSDQHEILQNVHEELLFKFKSLVSL